MIIEKHYINNTEVYLWIDENGTAYADRLGLCMLFRTSYDNIAKGVIKYRKEVDNTKTFQKDLTPENPDRIVPHREYYDLDDLLELKDYIMEAAGKDVNENMYNDVINLLKNYREYDIADKEAASCVELVEDNYKALSEALLNDCSIKLNAIGSGSISLSFPNGAVFNINAYNNNLSMQYGYNCEI